MTVDARRAWRRKQAWQVVLVLLVCTVLGGHDVLRDWLVAHGWSRFWGLTWEAVALSGLLWLSSRNHRCPACQGALRLVMGLRECPHCAARFT